MFAIIKMRSQNPIILTAIAIDMGILPSSPYIIHVVLRVHFLTLSINTKPTMQYFNDTDIFVTPHFFYIIKLTTFEFRQLSVALVNPFNLISTIDNAWLAADIRAI
jgi:hypothetical protein